jgi:hypothetical protein
VARSTEVPAAALPQAFPLPYQAFPHQIAEPDARTPSSFVQNEDEGESNPESALKAIEPAGNPEDDSGKERAYQASDRKPPLASR